MHFKKQKNKYIITYDNKNIETYEEVVIKLNLLYKKTLDEKIINQIKIENEFYDQYSKITKFISKKVRSKKQIENEIENNNFKEKIINKLKQNNLINDEFYCQCYINDKLKLTNDGPNKIYKKLKEENIDDDIINKYLNVEQELINNKINKYIEKKSKTNKHSENALKIKITNELINLGYNKEDVINNLDKIKKDDKNIISIEYNKIYNKLKNKYQGKELNTKIINKMLLKGFNYSDIKEQEKKQ